MLLVLVRHASAAPGRPDAERPLTEAGKEEARRVGEQLAAGARPAVVLSSPLVRARETAAAIAGETGARLVVDGRLAPGATADGVVEAAAEQGTEVVAAVAHQPDCSHIALSLTGTDPGFPPAGVAEIDLAG